MCEPITAGLNGVPAVQPVEHDFDLVARAIEGCVVGIVAVRFDAARFLPPVRVRVFRLCENPQGEAVIGSAILPKAGLENSLIGIPFG